MPSFFLKSFYGLDPLLMFFVFHSVFPVTSRKIDTISLHTQDFTAEASLRMVTPGAGMLGVTLYV